MFGEPPLSEDPIVRAREEFKKELFDEAVAREKDKLRRQHGRPWWQRLFPWRIRIERND